MNRKLKKNNANRALGSYLEEISKYDPLSPEEEVELAQKIRQGDDHAKRKLTEANLRFVVSVAKEYQGNGLPLTDLINEGNLGLIKAAERFDETRGFKFISYAVWWIRQSILQALAEHSRIVRLPLNRVGTIKKITKELENLEMQYERAPSQDELALGLKMDTEDVSNSIKISKRHHSLDKPFKDGEENTLSDILNDESIPEPDIQLMMDSLKRDIKSSLNSLKEKERDVLMLYFGIDSEYPKTLNEIGEKFNLTRERIRQIKDKAINRLRHKSRSSVLRSYLG
ncbi:MAG: sigma-70 family RNA polymerase sigma factor [Candidatus Marinimicrobia bacterium]|nr:sigma-70 family RNA polymerase sigma factor [Candidatus Neomarinimicrobiota bacterium]